MKQQEAKTEVKIIEIKQSLVKKVGDAIEAALMYEEATQGKRKMGITGEVGEIMVCHKLKDLGLKLVTDPRSQGFDAIDKNGKRVQIKTRRSESAGEPKLVGRMSRFSEHPFDYALLAFLDKKYNLCRVWKLSYDKVMNIKNKEQTDRSGPRLSSFIKEAGDPIYNKDCS